MTTAMTPARRILDLRARAELTQPELAELAGVSVRQLQRWEAGESVPYPRNAERLARAFGVTAAEILGEASGPPETMADLGARMSEIARSLQQLVLRAVDDPDARAEMERLSNEAREIAAEVAAASEPDPVELRLAKARDLLDEDRVGADRASLLVDLFYRALDAAGLPEAHAIRPPVEHGAEHDLPQEMVRALEEAVEEHDRRGGEAAGTRAANEATPRGAAPSARRAP